MNILFLSLSDYDSIYIRGLYTDLLRQFVSHGHQAFLISPIERKSGKKEAIIQEHGATIVKVRIWNMQKANIVEKGVSMLTIDKILIRAVKKYFPDVKFDLILYPTPPITLLKAVEYVKKRDGAKAYLLLKDIFPQNAVDIGLMRTTGAKGLLYRYFRRQEKRLYAVSDRIGCMSEANVEYVLAHNPEVDAGKVEVCPNAVEPIDMSCSGEERRELRLKYGLPTDKTVFVYGGNLGKPQDIPFIIQCLRRCRDMERVSFLIVGNGTEYGKLEKFVNEEKPENVKLMSRLPRDDYDKMIGSCDIGLIFLDHRFTIPNFPSRLLGYMAAKLPILACTDAHSDIGRTITEGGFGWWRESNDAEAFAKLVDAISQAAPDILHEMRENAFRYLRERYSSRDCYKTIVHQ